MNRPCSRPWREAPLGVLRDCIGVMTDIDDTLTRDGAIEPAALAALQALDVAGVPVVAITGRPLGWSEAIATEWPVAAVVAENGGVAIVRTTVGGRSGWARCFAQDEATRAVNTLRLQATAARLLRELPHARLARDSAGRVTDIAVDHAEFEVLDAETIGHVVATMRSEGMQASVSSIHINGWYGQHDKWTGACWMLRELWGRSLPDEVSRWVYVGDSTNDQEMFRRFELSVGVANLLRFADAIECWPTWLCDAERGEGFAEVARALLASRTEGAGLTTPELRS